MFGEVVHITHCAKERKIVKFAIWCKITLNGADGENIV